MYSYCDRTSYYFSFIHSFIYCIIQTADRISCLPTKEKTVSVEDGENGIAVATVIEKCQCVTECYRKSFYEKYREVASGKEVVRMLVHY